MIQIQTQPRPQAGIKTGILLVAYGPNGDPGALALRGVSGRTRADFPDIPERWAFTSPRMRNRLAERGKKTDSVYKALCRMRFDGFTHVAVQSLHVIAGSEYEGLLSEVERARAAGGPAHIAVGLPLLGNPLETALAAEALLAHLPQGRASEDAVVCVGHGADTLKNGYAALAAEVRARDAGVFIASLSGEPGLDETLARLKEAGVRRVWLMPLLAVVGKHTEEDLAGAGPDSWRGRLNAAGFSCMTVLRGAAEYEGFLQIWLSHLKAALAKLATENDIDPI